MGSELRRQLREALGDDIKGLPRAVALEIADDARWDDGWNYDPDKGRRSKARLVELVRWTASKNERVVRNALRDLSLAGWEFRIPISKGKDGRLLYAVPGIAMQYRVPDFDVTPMVAANPEGTATTGPSGGEGTATTGPYGPEGPVTTAQGPVVTAEGPVTTVRETVTTGPPSLVSPASPSSPSLAGATGEAEAAAAEGLDADASQQEEIQGLPIEKKPKRAATKKGGSKHEAADGLAASFWERYGKGRAQSFIAVQTVIRTAIGNGVDRDELAHCLGAIGETRNNVSAGTIQFELGQRHKQTSGAPAGGHRPWQNPADQDEYDAPLIK